MYSKLVEKIKQLLKEQEVVIVAISGHGGSGKSTLADKLALQFNIGNDQIVRTDDLHAKNYMQVDDIYQQNDWEILTKLLTGVHNTDRLNYKTRDWKGNEGIVDVQRPNVLIIEGIRLVRPELLSYFDVSVWIDCPLELATRRAVERNRQQGDSEEEIILWDTKWVPEAKQYIEDVHPSRIADFVYTEFDSET